MEVILLERIGKLGQMGDVVRVKDGFARNFLLPRGKALRATADNKKRFDEMKAELQARNLEMKGEAGNWPATSTGRDYVVLRQASESRASCSDRSRPVTSPVSLRTTEPKSSRSQIVLNAPIKTIGQYKVPLALHPEVEVAITITVARSADEAERIARGEDDHRARARKRRRKLPRRPLPRRPCSSRSAKVQQEDGAAADEAKRHAGQTRRRQKEESGARLSAVQSPT